MPLSHSTLRLSPCSLPSPAVRKRQAPSAINSLRAKTSLSRAEVVERTLLGSQTAATRKPTAEGEPHILSSSDKAHSGRAATLEKTSPEQNPGSTAFQDSPQQGRGSILAHPHSTSHLSMGLAVSCGAGPAMRLCFNPPHVSFGEFGSKPLSKADTHMPHPGTAANIRQENSRHSNIEQPGLVRGKSSAGASQLP